ncbi:hypothetical protein TNCV_4162661 [Trichonephila clavipes]|nr:hypothetical protein TNCV_4162661 [Trichonephila clavipes]
MVGWLRRRYDFDQSRRVLLRSDLHSISVLMEQMETDPPDITNSCEERNRLSLEIEALDIVFNRCTELVNFQTPKLTPIIQSKPLIRSHAPAIPLVPATDFHAHHHPPRSKTKSILKQDRGLRD